ncbi:hypothetical protein N431DRAFT_72293 [Stipitochalara longipes BDJ]|nr:hypothetical protein N431DRAFT_72293 [Stipitochalara longipes BDJ]
MLTKFTLNGFTQLTNRYMIPCSLFVQACRGRHEAEPSYHNLSSRSSSKPWF